MPSKKLKIQIVSVVGTVLFEYSSVGNTLKKTLEKAAAADANLSSANLSSANLSSADLRFADLRSANLLSADLRSADLRFADLRFANLRFADLRSANLLSADLRSANLSSADLRYAKNLDSDRTDFWWHLHHEVLVETLTEPVRARINYIKKSKPKDEVELRLKLLKPVLGKIPSTDRGWNSLHKKECGCAWNGKTIFTKANGLEK